MSFEEAFNFRDVGGYSTRDGGYVGWGSVFRSDALHHLSPGDLRRFATLGVDRIIDLPRPEEIGAFGRVGSPRGRSSTSPCPSSR